MLWLLRGEYAIPTKESVHNRLTDMQSKLVHIIKNWELSGQGKGSHVSYERKNEDDIVTDNSDSISSAQLGHLEGHTAYALHSWHNFLDNGIHGKVGTWLLYYWELFDKF